MRRILFFIFLSICFCGLILIAPSFAQTKTPTSAQQKDLDAQNAELLKKLDQTLKDLQKQIDEENAAALKRIEDVQNKVGLNLDEFSSDVSKNVQKRLEDQHREQQAQTHNLRRIARAAVYGLVALFFCGAFFLKKFKSRKKH